MKLHWSPKSPFVRKVVMAAHELRLIDRIELVRSVAAMSTPNPAIMQDNPLGKIPAMVLEDGSVIAASFAICDHLDQLAGGGKIIPARGLERRRAMAWHALGNGLTDLAILWRNERSKPEERQTAAWLEGFALKGEATLNRLEQEADALEAAPFAIGHIAIGCALSYLDFRFKDLEWRDGRPNLARWHREAFETRPSARATEVADD